jgi:hypothetical protein
MMTYPTTVVLQLQLQKQSRTIASAVAHVPMTPALSQTGCLKLQEQHRQQPARQHLRRRPLRRRPLPVSLRLALPSILPKPG